MTGLDDKVADDVTRAIKQAVDDVAAGKAPRELTAAPAPAAAVPPLGALNHNAVAENGNVVLTSRLGPLVQLTIFTPQEALDLAALFAQLARVAFDQRIAAASPAAPAAKPN